MSISESIDSLRKIELSELDFNNLGAWPAPVRAIACILVVAAVLALGYYFHLKDLQADLERRQAEEVTLKAEFVDKAAQAANLEAYKEQMVEMEKSFGALLRQLPSDTEVPGLLEDITRTGLNSGLEFKEIKLLKEEAQPFYVELPIQISVIGSYHDFATFASGAASLPRIVTLHDFKIDQNQDTRLDSGAKLQMNILAKTYRYNDQEAAQ
jgi:type IV pilus assembly protein PilO